MFSRKIISFKSVIGILLLLIFVTVSIQILNFHQKVQNFNNLGIKIKNIADTEGLDYAMFLKRLNFPRLVLNHNMDERFPAASLIKLPILAAAFIQVEEGTISLNDNFLIKKKDVTGGSGKLKAFKLPYSLSFKDLLEYMISYSDNTATNKVINLVGFESVKNAITRIGLRNTNLSRYLMDFSSRRKGVENYTSAYDMAVILEKIYNKQLISEDLSELALKLLKNQTVNDRIPRYLPADISVGHKTGLERGVVHDVGIVFTPKGDYIICLLVRSFKDYQQAKDFIAKVSLLIYDLFR